MNGHPEWRVDIDLFGDDDVIFARATLHAQHTTVVGRGAARPCVGVRLEAPMGDSMAVGAALQDLGRQLIDGSRKRRGRSTHQEPTRRKNHDHRAHSG